MADYIEVNMQTLEQDVQEMRELLESIEKDMDGMFATVKELDTMWDGPANQEFNRQFLRDRQVMTSVCEAAEGVIDSMENAKESYRKCEASVKAEIDGIKIES